MDTLRLGLRFLGAILSTAFSRLRRGPARPSWSFLFEATVLAMRRTGRVMARLEPLKEAGEFLPRAAVLLCPWVDVSARGGSLEKNAEWDWALPADFIDWAAGYADKTLWQDARVSPSYATLTGLPPLFIQVGGAEMLVDQVREFALKAEAAGVEVRLTVEPDMIHDWHLLASISTVAARSIAEAGAFIREVVPVPGLGQAGAQPVQEHSAALVPQ